jgi:UDP-N-acetylmuramate dehydrogenase
MSITQQLTQIVGSRVIENEPMSRHTNYRIGGSAKWLVEVRTVEELQAVLSLANEARVATVVLGGGSNVLVSDAGFDGIVIKIAMRSYEIHGTTVKAQAGVLSSALARSTAVHGLSGLAWAISLPGTAGGGVRGNAGCFGGQMGDHITKVEVLRGGKIIEIPKNELGFGYRDSIFKHNSDIIISATFELEIGDALELKAEIDDTLMKRRVSQPLNAGSAGCVFKNVIVTDDDLKRLAGKLDIPPAMSLSRCLSAGWLIDRLDLKGTQIGEARISEAHGNFIVNSGSATADDIVQLIALVKTRARDEYGIMLEEEIEYVGFN